MQAVSRIVAHNLRSRISSLEPLINATEYLKLLTIFSRISFGYEFTLTPNGILRQNDLEELVSIDSDIAILLISLESTLKSNTKGQIDDDKLALLQDLLNKRSKLIDRFKA
jgi:hypothetical protein